MRPHHLLATLALGIGLQAHAGEGHHTHAPLHGGVVSEASHLSFELVPHPGGVTLHVRDHGKPANVEGGTARLTVLTGQLKSTLALKVDGAGRFTATTPASIPAGSKVVALVNLPGRKAAQARFSLP